MKRERTGLFLWFVVCSVATAAAWGDGGILEKGAAGRIDSLGTSAAKMVTLCHRPPSNPCDAKTIVVPLAEVRAHLEHGDSLGECPPACHDFPAAVPKTGQTKCSDEEGNPIDCAGTGQDGEYQKGVSVDPRFTANPDGTVKDNLTGLIWLKDANCFGPRMWTDALAISNDLSSGSCGLADGSVAGSWRLPNVKELQSLIDFSQISPTLPAGHPFSGVVVDGLYWTSTSSADYADEAWTVHLDDGHFGPGDKPRSTLYVWPVRSVATAPAAWGDGGILEKGAAGRIDSLGTSAAKMVTLCHRPPSNPCDAKTIVVSLAEVRAHSEHGDSLGECPSACGFSPAVPKTGQTRCWDEGGNPIDCAGTGQDGEYQKGVSVDPRFTANPDGTVKDNLTGLIWLKDANCFGPRTWTDALAVSNNLSSGSCGLADGSVVGSWRLPNVKELQSLIDFSQISPTLPAGHPFSGVVVDGLYWMSTSSADYANDAWTVYLDDGYFDALDKSSPANYVWPVRDGR